MYKRQLSFDATNTNVTTGNAFADLLLGNISTFSQVNLEPKYYSRYQFVEPYINDDFHITPRLTLNLGLRLSLFGTYYEKEKNTYNFEAGAFNPVSYTHLDVYKRQVHDSSGAVVVGAEVNISSSAIGLNKTVTTNTNGDWVTPYIPNGTYNVTVTAKGFKKYEAKGVVLRVGQTAKVDVTLEVGAITNEVTVVGEGLAQVETESAQVGGVLTGTEITQLQLNGRDFAQLITLTPGCLLYTSRCV